MIIGHSERRTLHGETDDDVERQGRSPPTATGSSRSSASARRQRTSRQHGPSAVPVAQLRAALEGVDAVEGPRRRLRAGLGDRLRPGGDARAGRAGLRGASRACIAELLGDDVAASDAHPLRRLGEVGEHRRRSCASRTSTAPSSAVRASTSTSSRASSASRSTSAPERDGSPRHRRGVRLYSIVGTDTLRRARKGSPWRFSRSSCRSCSVSRASC